MKRLKKFLVYYELHVDDTTFYIHQLVEARTKEEALVNMKDIGGKSYHLQPKGVLGDLDSWKSQAMLGEIGGPA